PREQMLWFSIPMSPTCSETPSPSTRRCAPSPTSSTFNRTRVAPLAEPAVPADGQKLAAPERHHVSPHGLRVEPRSTAGMTMPQHRIYRMKFSSVYPMYVQKAERKNRTKEDVDQVIRWLTGYSQVELQSQIELQSDFETFFAKAPMFNPN